MKFLSLRVRGFGSLPPGDYRFADRTLVVEDNAAGKSTLAVALRAALYGLEGDRRRQGGFTDLDAWRPWRGDAYALELRLATRDGEFTIERDFAPPGGRLTVRDGAGGDVTARFLAGRGRDRAGEMLAGVGEAEFLRAALAPDRAWGRPWSEGDSGRLADLLGRVVSSGEGGGPAAAAIAACDEALRRYDGVTVKGPAQVDTEIQRLEQRLGQIRVDRESISRRHETALATLTRLEDLRGERQRLDAALSANRRRQLQAQATRQRRDLETRATIEAEQAQASQEAAALSRYDGFPHGREAEIAAWAERCEQGDREAQVRLRRVEASLQPELAQLEADLLAAGAAGAGALGDLESGVGALLEREGRLGELRAGREALRARVEAEGEDPELQERLHAGLDRLGETERRFLRDQERLDFAREETTARFDRDESLARDAMSGWDRAAAGFARGRNVALAVAVTATAGALAALLLRRPDAGVPWALCGAGATLALAGAAGALWLHRRAAALRRRRELQGSERLAALRREREALAQQEAARRDRLGELSPAVLGTPSGAQTAPTADDLVSICRRHESFQVRHADWFRLGERIAEEEAEVARLQARLAPLLDGAPEPAAGAGGGATSRLQAELARRRRVAELEREAARLREAIATAREEAADHAERAGEASRRAAAILAVLPSGCRFAAREEAAAVAQEEAAGAAGGVRAEIERLAPLFRREPGAAATWFTTCAAEAAQARRLAVDTLPALAKRLAELPAAATAGRLLAAAESELALLDAADALAGVAAAAAAAPDTGADPADLVAAGEVLHARRGALDAEIVERARGVTDVERERRAQLPDLDREERELQGALYRARDFRDAVSLAREVIARHAGDVHGRWAAVLDADAARLATRLCPEIAGIAFSPTLDYTVTLADGRRLDGAHADRLLSSGVRDQLMLAVRLALARFLARPGDPLPLVLDDPFARWDDDRFRRGMAVLAGEAADHQVILLTCQGGRVRWLQDQEPGVTARWTRLDLA